MSYSRDQSAQLMQALVEGDEEALRELIRLWERPLTHFCYRYLQNESEARELVHETFVRVYQYRARFLPAGTFSTWLFAIAVNLCRNRHRWHRRHPALSLDWLFSGENEETPMQVPCPRPTPDHVALERERVLAVRRAIEALPHELKSALLLFEYENLGYKEIALVLGCSERGVESRLARARALLRQTLAPLLSGGLDAEALELQRG